MWEYSMSNFLWCAKCFTLIQLPDDVNPDNFLGTYHHLHNEARYELRIVDGNTARMLERAGKGVVHTDVEPIRDPSTTLKATNWLCDWNAELAILLKEGA
jgi:hypothetical protein